MRDLTIDKGRRRKGISEQGRGRKPRAVPKQDDNSPEGSNPSPGPPIPDAMQNALRASEQRFALFMEHLSGAAWIKDVDGHYTYANATAERFFSRPVSDILGATDENLYPVKVAARLAENDRQALLNGTHTAIEVMPEAGVTHYYEISVFAIRDRDGQPALLGGIAIDVTERRRHDAALSLTASIVDSSEDAIISQDLNGTILSWNHAARHIFGYTAEEVIGRSSSILAPPDRRHEENLALEKLLNGERAEYLETVRLRKDGNRIDVLVTISPIRDAGGAIFGTSHIARDITDRKRLDEKLRQTAKLESLGVLAGGVAHDFNNLLTVILGDTSLCLQSLSPADEARSLIEHSAEAAEKAAHLTRQLLAYAGRGRHLVQVVNLSDAVREISALVRTSVPKAVDLRLELEEGLPCVEADVAQIQQLIMNLIINGAEAIPEGDAGAVFVSISAQQIDAAYIRQTVWEGELTPGQYVVLEVRDTGVGMDEGTSSRIFEPFFSTKITGRGLGLAATRGIIRAHKGAMRVESTPGKGTTFRVLLPATWQKKTEAPPETREAAIPVTALVVDDEEAVRKTVVSMLETSGSRAFVAKDGEEAIHIFRRHNEIIDVVLLDLTMPVMGGERALEEFRVINPKVPVIVSSGYSEVEIARKFAGRRIAGFLPKPYTLPGLTGCIRRAIARPAIG